jgi:hypothetical protein
MALPGIASADQGDPLKGMTYGDAVAAVEKAEPDRKIVVANTVGSLLERDDCIVTHSTRHVQRGPSGRPIGSTVQVILDCNNPLASPGKAGGSAASPAGKKEKFIEDTLTLLNAHPELCDSDAAAHERCVHFCEETVPGKCTFELS